MAKPNIEIKDKGIAKYLSRLVKFGANPTSFLQNLGQRYKDQIQSSFNTARDPYGTPWKPLTSRKGQPLRDTRRLMSSINTSVSKNTLRLGTNVKYAPTHQFGNVIKAKDKPGKKIFAQKGHALKITLKSGQVIFRKSVMRPHMLAFKIGGRWVFARQVTIPARPFFPDASRGLPKSWQTDAGKLFKAEVALQK